MKKTETGGSWRGFFGMVLKLAILLVILGILWSYLMPSFYKAVPEKGPPKNYLDHILANLPVGQLAHQIPSEVPMNSQATAMLVLSPSATHEELQAYFDDSMPVEFAEAKIGQRMRARLQGTKGNLKIAPLGSEDQAVSFNTNTKWEWTITPEKPGAERVVLSVDILLKVDGENTYRTIRTYQESVEVTTTTVGRVSMFWGKHWKWVIGTFLLPLSVFMYRKYKK